MKRKSKYSPQKSLQQCDVFYVDKKTGFSLFHRANLKVSMILQKLTFPHQSKHRTAILYTHLHYYHSYAIIFTELHFILE